MAALIPYFISNIFQIGAYVFCMAYLTGELAELKKRPLTTGISFIVMYFTSIIIQRYDNDWVTIGLSLILSLYCLLLYLNTSKTLSQCFNIVILRVSDRNTLPVRLYFTVYYSACSSGRQWIQ